ncbi:MAG TPA: SurA N-terminal domain-containing protein, partial [Erythrobacter sp.]|nr:SurA N-terminal domain-containing protein [Erythrobacter sp.]
MITFFRQFFGSKLGLGLTLGFLALIAFAFASSDVANTGTFGGVSGGDRVAVVGSEKIGTADFFRSANSAMDQVRQENPTITMASFIAQGGLDEVLKQMIDRS